MVGGATLDVIGNDRGTSFDTMYCWIFIANTIGIMLRLTCRQALWGWQTKIIRGANKRAGRQVCATPRMGQAKQEGRQAHLGGGQRTHICLERGRQALQMSSPKQGFAARTCLPWQRNGTICCGQNTRYVAN